MTPRLWQTRIFFTWGIVLACQAAVQNRQGLLALRFLLAVLETGSYPGILTQLNSWYPSDEMATPVMWLLGISQCSSIVGSLLCYGISYMDGIRGLSAWRWYVSPFGALALTCDIKLTENGIGYSSLRVLSPFSSRVLYFSCSPITPNLRGVTNGSAHANKNLLRLGWVTVLLKQPIRPSAKRRSSLLSDRPFNGLLHSPRCSLTSECTRFSGIFQPLPRVSALQSCQPTSCSTSHQLPQASLA